MRLTILLAALALPALALVTLGSATEVPACLPGLTATPLNAGAITLAWPGVAGASAYQVLFRTPTTDWFPITPQVPAGSTVYTLNDVQAGVPYDFAVAAVDHGRVLATYCTVSATYAPPDCPANLSAERRPNGSIHLSWDAVDGADGYNVYGPTWDGPMMFQGHVLAANATDGAPPPAVPLRYTVNATAGDLESRGCPVVTVAVVPFFPTPAGWALAAVGAALAGVVLLRRKA